MKGPRKVSTYVWKVIEETKQRWLPVDRFWSGPKPDHDYYIRPDYSPCCEWHDEHAFHPGSPWRDI